MSKTLTIKDQTSAVVIRDGDRVRPAKGINKPGVWKNYSDDPEQYDHHRSERRKPKPTMGTAKGRRSGDKHLKFKAKREAVEDRIIRAIDGERRTKRQAQPINQNLTDAERKRRRDRKRRQKAKKTAA